MNLRFVNCLVAVIGLVSIGVQGDVTDLPPDPPIAATAQSALNMTPFANELAKVGPEVDKLVQNASDKPTVSMVRTWLIAQDNPAATNPYQEAYAAALNDAFDKALSQPGTPITAKINIGIVIKSLAGPKANLAQTVADLLNDSNAIVALWGLKAAGAMLPGAMQDANFNGNGMRAAVLTAVVKAVTSHEDGPLSGPIADEAYRAINPKMWQGPLPTGDGFSAMIDANLNLQAAAPGGIPEHRRPGVPQRGQLSVVSASVPRRLAGDDSGAATSGGSAGGEFCIVGGAAFRGVTPGAELVHGPD